MIKVNERFALEVDALNYKLMSFRTIDPTKAPGFKEGSDTTLRQEWKSEDRYYPATSNGLAAALQEIAHREAREQIKVKDVTLKEYIKILHDMHQSLEATVKGAIV